MNMESNYQKSKLNGLLSKLIYHYLLLKRLIQCWHLIHALSPRAAQAYYTTKRPIATLFPGHGCIDILTTERDFGSQATQVIDVRDLSFGHVVHGCVHNLVLADVRTTAAGIKCLYCM